MLQNFHTHDSGEDNANKHTKQHCLIHWPHFYQTRSAWSVDQGSNKNHSPAYNFAPTVTKFCVMWEGLSLPHDTKFGNCRCKIVDSRSFPSWSLIHGLRWSGLIKVGPAWSLADMAGISIMWSGNKFVGMIDISNETAFMCLPQDLTYDVSIGPGNGLVPSWHQAITWNKVD